MDSAIRTACIVVIIDIVMIIVAIVGMTLVIPKWVIFTAISIASVATIYAGGRVILSILRGDY